MRPCGSSPTIVAGWPARADVATAKCDEPHLELEAGLVRRSPAGDRAGWIAGYFTFLSIHSMLTDLGRVMAVPTARFQIIWDSMPIARETLKSTV